MTERSTVLTGVALLLTAAIWLQGLYLPFSARLEAARQEVAVAEERLAQALELKALQRQLEPLLDGSSQGGSLVSRLASRVDALDLRKRLKQMRTLPVRPGPEGASPVAEAAYLRFDNLDMRELGALLQDLERLERDVWVRKIDIRLQGQQAAMAILEIEELRTE